MLTAASTAAKKYSHSYSGLFFASLQGINLTTRKVTTMVCFSRKVTCSCLVFCLLYIHQVKTRTSGSNSMVTGTNAIIAKGTQNEEMLENQGKHTHLIWCTHRYVQMYCLLYERRTKMTLTFPAASVRNIYSISRVCPIIISIIWRILTAVKSFTLLRYLWIYWSAGIPYSRGDQKTNNRI